MAWEGPFLREEQELLDNIAHRIGEYLEWKQRELGGERLGVAPEHWRWRQRFAERIAAAIDPIRFGVEAVYLFGSTEAGDANVGSDIDLLVTLDEDRTLLDLEAFRREAETVLGFNVDVATDDLLKPYVRKAALREAVAL